MYSGLVGGLLFAARAALLACVGGLAFIVRVCLRWFPALVSDCLRMPNHHVSLYKKYVLELVTKFGMSSHMLTTTISYSAPTSIPSAVQPASTPRAGPLCPTPLKCNDTKRCSSWACTGNPKPEQQTLEGTHVQETPAYQRRPTALHAVQGSNPNPQSGRYTCS